jgi:hypothetical protein
VEGEPQAEEHADRKDDAPKVDEVLPLQGRAKAAIAFLLMVIAADLFAAVADLGQLGLAERMLDNEPVSLKELNDSDDLVGISGAVYLVAVVVAVITFLLWYSRAYRNIIGMGVRNARYGTRWAVWYWFIPIVNLFRPKQVMNDIWKGSDPDLGADAVGWKERALPALLHWWWGIWLLANWIGNVYGRQALDDNSAPDELRDEAMISLAADLSDMVAAALGILVVHKITTRQEARRRKLAPDGSELS